MTLNLSRLQRTAGAGERNSDSDFRFIVAKTARRAMRFLLFLQFTEVGHLEALFSPRESLVIPIERTVKEENSHTLRSTCATFWTPLI